MSPSPSSIGTCLTLVLHNFLKQAGLLLGTGVRLFRPRDLAVYVVIAVSAGLLLVLQVTLSPPAVIGFLAAAVASLLVLGVGRNSLRAGQTFPELLRFRVMRLIVGR